MSDHDLDDLPEFAPELAAVEPMTLAWKRLSDVEIASIVFLDKPLWQASAFHLFVGRKGVGKGTAIADLASRITRGELGAKRNVVCIASEDSASIDIKPRVIAAGGDPERICTITDWVQLPRDIEALGNTITEVGEVGLLIIDPVGNHITGKNSNSDTDVRDAIAPLNELADRHEMTVVGVRHLSEKESSNGALAAILGSSAWVEVPRAVIGIARDNTDPSVAHVQCLAGNRLPPETPGRAFRIEGVLLDGLENEVTHAVWIGDSAENVETLIGERRKQPISKSDVARDLILDLLDESPGRRVESDQLDATVAKKTGLAAQTIRNVRAELKNEGLIESKPEKDEHGQVERWLIQRTNAARPQQGTVTGKPVTVPHETEAENGLNTPLTVTSLLHPPTVTGDKSGTSNRQTHIRDLDRLLDRDLVVGEGFGDATHPTLERDDPDSLKQGREAVASLYRSASVAEGMGDADFGASMRAAAFRFNGIAAKLGQAS